MPVTFQDLFRLNWWAGFDDFCSFKQLYEFLEFNDIGDILLEQRIYWAYLNISVNNPDNNTSYHETLWQMYY